MICFFVLLVVFQFQNSHSTVVTNNAAVLEGYAASTGTQRQQNPRAMTCDANGRLADFTNALQLAMRSLDEETYLYEDIPETKLPPSIDSITILDATGKVRDSTTSQLIGKSFTLPASGETKEGEYYIRFNSTEGISWILIKTKAEPLPGDCTAAQTSSHLNPDQSLAITNSVRAFAATVAKDITSRGPLAWRGHFADTPSFFMAANGQLIFANSDAATSGIKELPRIIAHIELRWGDPMLVDPLTQSQAMLAMPFHEVLVDHAGHRVESSGYFTGLAELGATGWKFRNAHWSVPGPTPTAP